MSIQFHIETNLHLNENISGSDQVIYYVDGPVGSHKTSSMYRFVAACPNARFTIGTPTNSMTDQISGGLEALGVSCLPIHRKEQEDGKKIEGSAVRYRNALKDGVRIVAINHDVALKLALDKMDCDHIKNPDLFAADNYSDIHLIIDEILSVYKRFTLKGMTLSNAWVSTYFDTLKPNENSEYYTLVLNTRGRDAWAAGFLEQQQPLSKQQRAIFDHTINERYLVKVAIKDLDELNRGERTSLSFFVTVHPSVLQQYRSATIIGANFKKSMLYKMWKDEVNFQPHPYITGDYDDFTHKHKAGAVINHYYFCEPTYSKSRLTEIGFENVFDKAALAIENIIPNTPYLFAVNNPANEGDPAYRWLTEDDGFADRISANPRGQNGHKDKNASAFLAAVNFSNIDTAFLDAECGITPIEAREAMTYENISQFHGRTSIRVFETTEANKKLSFFSPDHASALAMHKEFGGEDPVFIDLGFDQFRYAEEDERTEAERNADYTETRNENRNSRREEQRWSNEGARQYDGFTLAIWSKRGDSFPDFLEGLSWSDILRFIEDQTKVKRTKTHLPQIREGFFKNHNDHRTSGNIESTKLIQMDVDGSAVSPETFSTFLAEECGWTHVIYNSINSTEENPRFHFLIPLNQAVNRSVHERIFALVAEEIATKYDGVEFKLEVDRKSINHPIYSACLPKKAGGDIYIAREAAFLDVDAYLARRSPVAAIVKLKPSVAMAKNSQGVKIDHLEAIRIVSEIALEHATDKNRDRAFNLAGQALVYKHKMTPNEAIQALEMTLHLFGKDSDAPRRLVNSLINADGYQTNAA